MFKRKSSSACARSSGRPRSRQVVFISAEAKDFFAFASEPQIGSDNGEHAVFREFGKQAWRNHMDPGEGQRLRLRGKPNQFEIPVRSGAPPTKLHGFVKHQIA